MDETNTGLQLPGSWLNHHPFSHTQESQLECKWARLVPLQENVNPALISTCHTLLSNLSNSSLAQVLTWQCIQSYSAPMPWRSRDREKDRVQLPKLPQSRGNCTLRNAQSEPPTLWPACTPGEAFLLPLQMPQPLWSFSEPIPAEKEVALSASVLPE